jgi:F-type H+-transporting ATPase subunit a
MSGFFNTFSPLDQFEIINLLNIYAPVLGNLSISLTNIGLYLTIAGYLVFMIGILATNVNKVVPNQ